MKLFHASHSPWKSTNYVDSHITHRTTTTTHYDDRTALQKQRRYRFAATERQQRNMPRLRLSATFFYKNHQSPTT
jgi:hypothetical protein